jgi:uncharacterized protein (TIGR02646 family)
MKHIQKQSEPENFKKWKEEGPRVYSGLSGNLKNEVKKSLMTEQGYICCYCESSLVENDSHIEHVKPKNPNAYPELDLDYQNMHCSCLDEKKGYPLHCGPKKGNWYDEQLFISPLDANCETRFKFIIDGSIIDTANKNDNAAVETIARLGLDIPKLKALRKTVIDQFNSTDITNEELKTFVNDYLKKDADQKWKPYWTTIRQLYKDFVI